MATSSYFFHLTLLMVRGLDQELRGPHALVGIHMLEKRFPTPGGLEHVYILRRCPRVRKLTRAFRTTSP